ncbi:hypothetical protein QYE76_009392 [Lolium multiflorum]|uniref:MADS-box domain-containing protein n=1 Tax=Lolium multiflorum TaxID=4521 RepID=A0AAD8TRV5_LOLMU|nr:hypothetical protein QYE76_009392 [Lolium multiflorum]
MARKGERLKIQRITDEKRRKATLRKRLPIVVKKARELSILCNIPVCLIVYRPGEARPVVWPSPEAASNVVRRYRDLPDLDSCKNNLDIIDFLKQRNEKVRVKLSNVQRQTRDVEINLVLVDFLAGRRKSFDDLPIDIVTAVGSRVQDKLQAVKARLQELRSAAAPALLPPPPPAPVDVPMVDSLPMVQPHNGGYREMLDGNSLPTTEEMHALFVQAGIFPPSVPNQAP